MELPSSLSKLGSIQCRAIYDLLNKESSSSNRPLFRRSFRSKIENKPHFFMPYEYANLERARSRYATLSEVNSRSSLSRALRELALYLHEKI